MKLYSQTQSFVELSFLRFFALKKIFHKSDKLLVILYFEGISANFVLHEFTGRVFSLFKFRS